jgi:hypothetical protein
MTWEIVGKAAGTLLAMFLIAIVQAILRHAFGSEAMGGFYEVLAFVAVMSVALWLIWGRFP